MGQKGYLLLPGVPPPPPPQRRKGWEGEAAGSYPGPHTHALCSGTGLPDYGPCGFTLSLHLIDKEQS